MKYKQPKKKIPLFFQVGRIGERKIYQVEERLHKKGEMIEYDDKIGKVKKVTKKGIYVQEFKSNGIIEPANKTTFISERKMEEGKAYPFYPVIAI